VREESQSRRPSIKRPWVEDTILPEEGNGQLSGSLLPIDTAPYRRPSIPQGIESGAFLRSRYRESVANKKPKISGRDYNTFPQQTLDPNSANLPSRPPGEFSKVPSVIPIINLTSCFRCDLQPTPSRLGVAYFSDKRNTGCWRGCRV